MSSLSPINHLASTEEVMVEGLAQKMIKSNQALSVGSKIKNIARNLYTKDLGFSNAINLIKQKKYQIFQMNRETERQATKLALVTVIFATVFAGSVLFIDNERHILKVSVISSVVLLYLACFYKMVDGVQPPKKHTYEYLVEITDLEKQNIEKISELVIHVD